MITSLRNGNYLLGETARNIKVLYLDKKCYAWLYIPSIGDILSHSTTKHEIKSELSSGEYQLYEVSTEEDLIDLQHLELKTGSKHWQSYLLLTGLPHFGKKRSRIIPTQETVHEILARESTKKKTLSTTNA